MIPIINFSNPIYTLVALILFVLLLFIGRNTRRSFVPAIVLFVFLAIITCHSVELAVVGIEDQIVSDLAFSIAVDFAFILMSFISYLWIDDIEAKELKKRSIDNSLDWFWSKV